MEIQDYQYSILFDKLGYDFKYYPDKRMFKVEGLGFCKICDEIPSDEILKTCLEQCHNYTILLLNGNVTFKGFELFNDHTFPHSAEVTLIKKDDKYWPLFYGEYDLGIFPETDKAIALAINNGEDITCKNCGLVNEYTVSKPNKIYSVTCSCGRHIRNITENKPVILPFGKFKDRSVESMKTKEELDYLSWLVDNKDLNGRLEEAILRQIS